MTNKEWLTTLSNKQLAEILVGEEQKHENMRVIDNED